MARLLPRLLHALTFAILALLGLALAFSHPRFQFGTLVGDDAGYYLAIARNFCLGHGFSFDRVHATNGFNPLMPMLLIPLDRWLAPGYDLVTCFRIATLTTWLVVLAGLRPLFALTGRVLEEAGAAAPARALGGAAVLLFYAGFVALKGYYGMDAFLVLTIGLVYLERVSRLGLAPPGARSAVVDGTLLGLAVLARVDSLPLAVAAFALMALRAGLRWPAWRPVLARALPFTLIVASYLTWNRVGFGDWLPISARLKSAFPRLDLAASLDSVLHTSLNRIDQLAVFAGFGLALGWLVSAARAHARGARAANPPVADAMLVLALYLAARLGWLLAFSRFDVQGSYFVLAHPFIALVLLVAAQRLGGARALPAASVLLALVALALAAGKVATTGPAVQAIAAGRGDEWAAARRFHDAVGEHDVIFGDALGLIGYASDRAWMNGDGVANERAFQDAIRDHRLADYLKLAGVTHVVVSNSPPRPLPGASFAHGVPSRLHGAIDTLKLDPARLVLRESLRRGGGTELWLFGWGHGGPAAQISVGPGSRAGTSAQPPSR